MTEKELALFNRLRKKVADYIKKCLDEDPYCKPYEGEWEIHAEFPSYFEDKEAERPPILWRITLHCYLIGPQRHYD